MGIDAFDSTQGIAPAGGRTNTPNPHPGVARSAAGLGFGGTGLTQAQAALVMPRTYGGGGACMFDYEFRPA